MESGVETSSVHQKALEFVQNGDFLEAQNAGQSTLKKHSF